MLFNMFFMDLIVPFEYEKGYFKDLCKETLVPFERYFCGKRLNSNILNDRGRALLLGDNREDYQILKCFELKQQHRKTLGIHPNEAYCYRWLNEEKAFFCIKKIQCYFFTSGNGFLTFQIQAENWEQRQILDLKNKLTSVYGNTRISYELRTGMDRTEKKEITFRDVRENFLKILNESQINAHIFNNRAEVYSMSYGTVIDAGEKDISDTMGKLCLSRQSGMEGTVCGERKNLYRPFSYLYWSVSKNSLLAIGNLDKARALDKSNERFLTTEFPYSSFQQYFTLYLYYLSALKECEKVEMRCEMLLQNSPNGVSEDKDLIYDLMRIQKEIRPLYIEGERYEHIKELFQHYVYDMAFGLPSHLKKICDEYKTQIIQEKKYQIFISYRHDGGAYVALLLCKMLREKGIEVFLDMDSLRSGRFDDQLYEVIEQCSNIIAVLAPNSLERCLSDPEDWVRKEISYAFKKKKTVIPLMMEGFCFPENLPQDIEQIKNSHGVPSSARYFSGVVENIVKLIGQ